jgi:hypothetical protein
MLKVYQFPGGRVPGFCENRMNERDLIEQKAVAGPRYFSSSM